MLPMTDQTHEREKGAGEGFMAEGGMPPYVFVVGCPRSGTTLLQRMLDNHPKLAVANDTHFIPLGIEHLPPGIDPPLTPELVKRVRSFFFFPRLELPDDVVSAAVAASRTFRQFVIALYKEYARMRCKALAGEKTPDYVRHLPRLHGLFPWVRTVHLIRDGRDVALSALEWARNDKGPGRFALWQEQPVAVCALWWRMQAGTGRKDGAPLGSDRYCEVRYEDLVAQPEEVLHGLCAFLRLAFAPQMLDFHVGKVRPQPWLSAKDAWRPATPGLRDWRTQMAKRDVELFEALAGDLLADLGYERSFSEFSPEVAAIAGRCRRWWDKVMARRQADARSHAADYSNPSTEKMLEPSGCTPEEKLP
jgi:hypothetical protein